MAEKLFLVDINLNGNQLRNAAVEQLDAAPDSPKVGQIYFDTTVNKFKYWNGSNWQALIEYTYDENSFDSSDFAKGKLTVKNVLDNDEKALLESQLFGSKFTAVISASPSSVNFAGEDVNVTFTLVTKYGANTVDLDSTPAGWNRTAVGTYTKATVITKATGASVSSGAVNCTYKGKSKNSNSASTSVFKPSYILYSKKEALTADDLTNLDTTGTLLSSNNNIKATGKSIKPTEAGQYAYFCVSNTSSLSDVQQLGASILKDKTGVTLERANYGSYKVYRSANVLGTTPLSVNII